MYAYVWEGVGGWERERERERRCLPLPAYAGLQYHRCMCMCERVCEVRGLCACEIERVRAKLSSVALLMLSYCIIDVCRCVGGCVGMRGCVHERDSEDTAMVCAVVLLMLGYCIIDICVCVRKCVSEIACA